MLARDLALVRLTGAPMHFLHLSTAGLARDGAGGQGRRPPRHRRGHASSPRPKRRRRGGLRPGLQGQSAASERLGRGGASGQVFASGVIDAIATDHAPHAPERKEEPFDEAPAGMLGLETALAVAYGACVRGPGRDGGRRGRRLGAAGDGGGHVA